LKRLMMTIVLPSPLE